MKKMPILQTIELSEREGLTLLVHTTPPSGLAALLEHPQLEWQHVQLLLRRSDLTAEILERIGQNRTWVKNEAIRLGVVLHPHTPRRMAMTFLRLLQAANMVRVALTATAPSEVRCIAEEIVIERVRQLPLGEKLVLARRGPARIAAALLAEGHSDVLPTVLQSPFLTEAQVARVLWRSSVPPHVVIALAENSKWSCRYQVRLALIRNPHTPMVATLRFLPNLMTTDLRDLLRNGNLPAQVREPLRRELARRGGRNQRPT
jgi:hypothetical protein